ncbi:MAG: phasin family protein [Steroidobacteraceae bacterium]|jgi:poly(hydroxyalkanoate) granule-associated protein
MATKRKSKSVRKAKSTPPARVLDSMNQVWLAGLGAMSKARQGAPLMLQELIAEGARVQTQARGSAEKMLGGLVGEMKSTLNSSVKQVRSQTADALDNLEEMFQTRVHRALTQLGVPSAEDVQKLSQRVELLNASVNKLANGRKPAVRARARTATPRSTSSAHQAAH